MFPKKEKLVLYFEVPNKFFSFIGVHQAQIFSYANVYHPCVSGIMCHMPGVIDTGQLERSRIMTAENP